MGRTLTQDEMQRAIDAYAAAGGNEAEAARRLGVNRTTFADRLRRARAAKLSPAAIPGESPPELKAEIKRLRAECANLQKTALTHEAIKRGIIGLAQGAEATTAPAWLLRESSASAPGVPTLFLSDLHWGEVVHPSQINGVNRYDVKIAHQRLAKLAERAVRLLGIIDPKMGYPGLVLVLGGDMISGNIHDELTATNELNTMPTVLDLYGALVGFITAMADKLGRVFIPCVTGNHGRDTHKIWNKDRHHTSFDWLLYQLLAKHFEKDKRVSFLIPDGPDAYYKVYGHRYLLTHGDQFRGGDGMIGALGPIIRGDHRKRSRNGQIDMAYDTMIIGHWHQYIHLARLIVNGSLKGYDEYAYSNNFGFEDPQQALWITHPKYGITFRMPVYVGDKRAAPKTNWVSVAA